MWAYEFDQHGGYDAMTSAFNILRDGEITFFLDVGEFDDGAPWPSDEVGRWNAKHRRSPAAEALARQICARMNG